jgi:hypothetical protein
LTGAAHKPFRLKLAAIAVELLVQKKPRLAWGKARFFSEKQNQPLGTT